MLNHLIYHRLHASANHNLSERYWIWPRHPLASLDSVAECIVLFFDISLSELPNKSSISSEIAFKCSVSVRSIEKRSVGPRFTTYGFCVSTLLVDVDCESKLCSLNQIFASWCCFCLSHIDTWFTRNGKFHIFNRRIN